MLVRTLCLLVASLAATAGLADQPLQLQLSYQQETGDGTGRFHRLERSEVWDPASTAIIVCDMWDSHHCYRAVQREKEFAPRLDSLLVEARRRGATIIHAPSDCMQAYANHPARHRAQTTPKAPELPPEINTWCHQIPSEEQGEYPIDQSDGGEDDDPEEHARWEQQLRDQGRNPKAPWLRQIDLVRIDSETDFISDSGEEIWSILHDRGIDNVMLAGVHTNMCVLGRPFGLRQMARNGKNVVLVRDMTDTMYNPKARPFVSHFTGTDLIIDHIERYVCPTITSDQILTGESAPFRFSQDTRPHIAIVVAEDEYETERTLTEFAASHLGQEFRVSFVFGSESERNDLPGLHLLRDADVLLLSVRRRTLPGDQMDVFRRWVAAGKPVIGIRTSSHAFAAGGGRDVSEPLAEWPEFDAQVFGGNYNGHHGNALQATIQAADGALSHPILEGVDVQPFTAGGSLYRTSPLADATQLLLAGSVPGHPSEPVAWTFQRADGGRSFYTSLGHRSDFANPAFTRMLTGALRWAATEEPAELVGRGR